MTAMTNIDRIEALSAVFDALSANPPRLMEAEVIYRTIPGCEDCPLPTVAHLETAIHLRKAVRDAAERRAESDARSDAGDNFLSQWANGLTSQLDNLKIEIAEQGGTASFDGLFVKATGARVPAKQIETHWGTSWMVCDPVTGRATGVFYPAGKNGPRTKLGKAGLEEREERAPARAYMAGSGRGTGGQAWAAINRTDGGWPGAPDSSSVGAAARALSTASV